MPDDSSASNEWTGSDDLTNTDSIELDLTGIEDYSSIYYTVEYYGAVVYTSETGTYQGVYNTSDAPLRTGTCTVTVD